MEKACVRWRSEGSTAMVVTVFREIIKTLTSSK